MPDSFHPSDGVATITLTYQELLEMTIFNLQTADPPLVFQDERDYLIYLKDPKFYNKFTWLEWPDNYVDMRGHTGGSLGDLFALCSDPEPPEDLFKYHLIPSAYTPSVHWFEEHSMVANLYKIAKQFNETQRCPDDMVPYPERPEPIETGLVPEPDATLESYLSDLKLNDHLESKILKAKSLNELENMETLVYSDEGPITAGLEYLDFIRNGPANKIGTYEYIDITLVRTAKGVEQPEKCSVNPPSSISDNGYEELDPEVNVKTQRQGTPEYLSQWTKYNESPVAWHVIMQDQIVCAKIPNIVNSPRPVFDPEEIIPFPAIIRNPMRCYQKVFSPNWKYRIPEKFEGHEKEWLFHRYLSRIPETAKPQDIHHLAFYDGTASADGGHGFMIQEIQHLEAPRDMSDDETRLRWHETAAGHATNMSMMKKLWSIQRDADRYDQIIDEFADAWKSL
ncbi:hypothetical protein N7504_001431 [Penicillium tannophilum]|nr:hypothetical protein N7504_001431 [Penicillium tannophilum]